jgi:hypothetical protein
VVKKFLKRAQNKFDNVTEFKNTQVEDYFDEEGIKHEFSNPPILLNKIG